MGKSKILITFITITSIVFYISYTSWPKNSGNFFNNKIESTSNRDRLPMAKKDGVSLGLYNTDGKIEKSPVIKAKKGESIKRFISLGHLIDQPRVYKILLLLDYKQCSFIVDGEKQTKSYTVHMNSNQTLEIPVEIEPLQEGLHDAIFVIVKYPDNKSLDDSFRKVTDMNHLLFLRFSIAVGSNTVPNYANDEFSIINRDVLNGVFLSKNKDKLMQWLSEDLMPNSDLEYYIHIGNKTDSESNQYALIILFDWSQVPIINNKDALFLEVKRGQEVVIHSKLKMPEQKGVYDITPILIHNPYKLLDISNKRVETSIRTAIKVE